MKCDELFKKLKDKGWKEVRQAGSHKIMKHPEFNNHISFPYHKGKEIPTGTLSDILKKAGLK